jgi:phospholipase/lecithinase/hemolysin
MFSELLSFLFLAISLRLVAGATLATAPNSGIHLAVGPKCGTLTGTPVDVNAGLLPLKSYKTLVTFGDSYTDGGVRNGGPLLPAVLSPPNPKAGGRTTNGPVWAEGLTADTGATLKDYAVGGAVTDAKLWPSKGTASDFVTQAQLFLSQNNNLNPATTLYSVFFGINDVSASKTDGVANLPVAAQTIIDQITLLTKSPTNARHFLVLDDYGRGSSSTAGDAFKQKYFTGLQTLSKTISGFKVAFVDLKTIWNGVLGSSPGFAAFGYTSSGACTLNSSTTVGACNDPDHTFYWIPGHPSKQTHRIMADYVEQVLVNCAI